MKQYKIINAYRALNALSNNDRFSYEVLWSLYQLKKDLQPHAEFYDEALNKINQKYSQYADENGMIKGDPFKEYSIQLSELEQMEKDVSDIDKPVLKIKDMPGISLQVVEALEDFIEFQKE